MAGTWVAPAPEPEPAMEPLAALAGTQTNGSGGAEVPANQLDLISRSILSVASRLYVNIRNGPNNDSAAFFNLCISLARGIDFAIANEEVPSKAGVLLPLLKKNACQSGWFSDRDSEELCILFKEMGSNFCCVSNLITEPSSSVSIIPEIMSRFYPTMKMGHIFASLEIKPGYGAFMNDFQILKNSISPSDGIRLFVVQTDNMETSSCLISPPKVNFLINGKGVERRTTVYVDSGPQNPTVVTRMLRYRTNLLQAVGEFNGNYIVAVALMSVTSIPSSDTLQQYAYPAPATIDSDSEVIEGPSQISLNCPISLIRIKTPVKGHLCKHLQCFDFENYVNINSRRPSWRCPQCNQHTCFTDIRISQKMVEILKEVGTNITRVIVSSDGSWNATSEIYGNEKPEDLASIFGQDGSARPESDVLDLTVINDRIDSNDNQETEDRKVSLNACANLSKTQNLMVEPQAANTNYINHDSVPVENEFSVGWGSNVSEPQIASVFGFTPNNFYSSPNTADAIIPAPYCEAETFHANAHNATSGSRSQTPLPHTLPLQQFQYGNPTSSNEHGRLQSTTGHVNRTLIAFQALPEQAPEPALQQIPRNYMNTLIPTGFSTVPCSGGSRQQLSRSHPNLLEVSQMASSSLPQYPGIQNGLWAPTQPQNSCQGPSLDTVSRRTSQAMNQYLYPIQSSMQSNAGFSQPQVRQRGPQSGIGQSTGATGSHQALNHSLGSIPSSMQSNNDFSQPQVHQCRPQSGIGQSTGAMGSHQALNYSLGSIHASMHSNANFSQPQVHRRGPQSEIGQATGATGRHQAMNYSLGSTQSSMQWNANFSQPQVQQRGPQSGTGRATGATESHQAMNHASGLMQSSMQWNAYFSQPQIHQGAPQSVTGQATGATSRHRAMNHSVGSIQSSMQWNANFSQPQIHQRVPQSGTGQATGVIDQAVNHSLSLIHSSMQSNDQPQVHQRGPLSETGQAAIGSQQDHLAIAAQRNVNAQVTMPVETSKTMNPFQINPEGCRVPSPEGASLYDQNWRPTARMRGALSGQAYFDALNQFIIQPTQKAQATRPIVNVTTPASSSQTPTQAPIANRVAQDPGTWNHTSAGPVTDPGSSDVSWII
ncbi:uncharacterized protein LOC111407597 isoform X2 [Olea europaea var. sylvestris]|uniref:uncharacterized protein LOC111407597 isoform X2 n=1 Tax=Olea europaea var. sylvestris TaxID=158386 RepID=UPI000C1D7DDD|nr:uncharacterized protein LOC111407597 isoform X2 [Olea europaea var. sylvestris]